MKNKSTKYPCTWKEDGLTYKEIIRQEYTNNNCIVRGGFVKGNNKPSVDTVFLRLEKDGVEPTTLLLTPDEMQAIVWVTSGTIWSHLMNNKKPD